MPVLIDSVYLLLTDQYRHAWYTNASSRVCTLQLSTSKTSAGSLRSQGAAVFMLLNGIHRTTPVQQCCEWQVGQSESQAGPAGVVGFAHRPAQRLLQAAGERGPASRRGAAATGAGAAAAYSTQCAHFPAGPARACFGRALVPPPPTGTADGRHYIHCGCHHRLGRWLPSAQGARPFCMHAMPP